MLATNVLKWYQMVTECMLISMLDGHPDVEAERQEVS
jgi:hypothetical protein